MSVYALSVMKHREKPLKQPLSPGLLAATLISMMTGWQFPLYAQLVPQETPSLAQTGQISQGILSDPILRHTLIGHTTPIRSLIFSRDGRTLISGGGTNEPFLKFWSVETGEEVDTLRAQSSAILTVALSPNGQTLVTSGEDADIHFWSLPAIEGKVTFFDHYSYVLALAVTPDSKLVVSGALDGLRVWTLNPPHFLFQLEGFGTPAYSLAMHPNGYLVASGDNRGGVRFWNLRERTLVSEFFPHKESITGLVITSDGKTLITASQDATIKLWDIPTGNLISTLVGHKGKIQAIALSPDGKILASASNDGVRLWAMEDGRLLRRFSDHADWVNALAFSPNGRFLASGGFDKMINIWELPPSFWEITPSTIENILK
ncbi:WD40 repeat domain-containing protein [Aphanothece sacrum]|uniref:WD40 repeat-containing protein n=1 Tax=Aphanothece sacrum FPU1 TaxID=1920663 RepID=A0A401IFQ2_APHSA|nr:WD40 repeat domain-containing protein [Aphanothece sacrum]GBF80115.1 WD40 repeat-containing protein [Aphanothece sacrum FPU1]